MNVTQTNVSLYYTASQRITNQGMDSTNPLGIISFVRLEYRIAGNCLRNKLIFAGLIFAVFIFAERKRDTLTKPLPDGGHAPYAHVYTEKMTLNDEAKQVCATTAYSSFCVKG